MIDYLFKLKKDGKTVGYLMLMGAEARYGFDSDECVYTHNIFEMQLCKEYQDSYQSFLSVLIAHPFITKDKNGKDVFADDKIKRVPYEGDPNPKPYQTEGRTGTVTWHHGFLQWCFLDDRTHHLDDLVDSEIFEAGIELIEDKDNE